MKAIIHLKNSMELSCDISTMSTLLVSFKISKEDATADALNAFFSMGASLYSYTDHISISMDRDNILSVQFV